MTSPTLATRTIRLAVSCEGATLSRQNARACSLSNGSTKPTLAPPCTQACRISVRPSRHSAKEARSSEATATDGADIRGPKHEETAGCAFRGGRSSVDEVSYRDTIVVLNPYRFPWHASECDCQRQKKAVHEEEPNDGHIENRIAGSSQTHPERRRRRGRCGAFSADSASIRLWPGGDIGQGSRHVS